MKTLSALFSPILALTLAAAPLPVAAALPGAASLSGAPSLPAQVAAAPVLPTTGAMIDSDFEDGTTQGWEVRETEGEGTQIAVVNVDTLDAANPAPGSTYAITLTGRDNQGDGAIFDAREALMPGDSYEFSAYALFLDGRAGSLTLSSQTDGDTFTNLIEFPNISFGEWTHITGTFTMPLFDDVALIYLETPWASGEAGNTDSFALDNIVISTPDMPTEIPQGLPALKDTLPGMNAGMAIDARETTGAAAELIVQQFNQIVAENHMKPEAWFDGVWNFERIGEGSENMRLHPQARAILDFAVANNLDVWVHVLIWHSQIPDWFFQVTPGGEWLSGEAGRAELLRRMDNLTYNQAKLISDEYGLFGSETNPITAWEVVNEVVSNSSFDDYGLRPSLWVQIVGEDFIDQAFMMADKYVNHEFADPNPRQQRFCEDTTALNSGKQRFCESGRPVSLWINDYNTEVSNKRARYLELVDRLLERGVPIDGIGQQFHLQMATPVGSVRSALDDFADVPVMQAVTELDITMALANPNEAQLEVQGHRYAEIFNLFREHQAEVNDLIGVTVWGISDGRSWRGDLAPVLFFANLDPKPAFWGAIGDLAALGQLRGAAMAFGDGFTADWARANSDAAFADVAWRNVPPQEFTDGAGDFRARWNDQGLVLLIDVPAGTDTVEITYYGENATINIDETAGNWNFATGTEAGGTPPAGSVITASARRLADGSAQVLAFMRDTGLMHGSAAQLDIRALAGSTDLGGWNSPGQQGTVTPVEALSFTWAVEADAPPTFENVFDPVERIALFDPASLGAGGDPRWAAGVAISTEVVQSGAEDGAHAIVHTLWDNDTLYVRFDVNDTTPDTSASDPWEQDSVEVFLDLGNAKNGEYRPWHDIQVRVSRDGDVTFGAGEPGRQAQRVSDVSVVDFPGGYVVELAIGLWTINEHQSRVDYGELNTFQGFDVQVNDAVGGERTSVHSWANPTDQGFQDTSRWGVIELVDTRDNIIEPAAPTAPGVGGVAGALGGSRTNPWLWPLAVGLPAIALLGLALWAWERSKRARLAAAPALPVEVQNDDEVIELPESDID